jgi:hypothetical protein
VLNVRSMRIPTKQVPDILQTTSNFEIGIVIYLVSRAMSTKHVESEARVMLLVLIEGLEGIKRL